MSEQADDSKLPMTISFDEVLRSTRSIRRRFDLARPVDLAVIEECLELATHAPSGSNRQGWHFIVVQDPELRASLGELYRVGHERYMRRIEVEEPTANRTGNASRLLESVNFLAQHIEQVPVHVIPCIVGRPPHAAPASVVAAFMASIIPATWSFMLACRARGLGTCWTTMHLACEAEAASLLGIPYEDVAQIALIPVGHVSDGRFGAAQRLPVSEVASVDRWLAGWSPRPQGP